MSNLIPVDDFGVTEKRRIPVVSSRKIAEKFDKRHDNVLRDIESLDCSKEFSALNFEESNTTAQIKKTGVL
ncbi:Rha family transcriptional regulator [Petroclostridium sp. X23]|uniref:Rha family transcriptional regulator n=1 Tax=Petroclostridium sp. X23 TaxID=3045146 RepID=UPI0024AE1E05|nr:Rha family transcriptional regulator [Petroclostridium sp. X23]WHH60406.1 Rha family transcriptional regulator [Petroclostridium sp. X23]